jgi:hypothetical protein
LIGLTRKSAEAAELTVIEGAANLSVSEEGKLEVDKGAEVPAGTCFNA